MNQNLNCVVVLLPSFTGLLLGFTEFSWFTQVFTGFYLVLPVTDRVLLCYDVAYRCNYLVLLGCYRVLLGSVRFLPGFT